MTDELEKKVAKLEKELADANRKIAGLQTSMDILVGMLAENFVEDEEISSSQGPQGPSLSDLNT